MRELLAFLFRFGGFFTFVVLELICLFLVVRYNKSQREIYLHSGNLLSATISERAELLADFLNLQEVADSLAAENARLRLQLLLQPGIYPDSMQRLVVDSGFILHPTRIVRNSVRRANNTLTIDFGSRQGAMPRQGVISGRSVVGIIRAVGTQYSEVLSLLHSESQISVRLQQAGYPGVLHWDGSDAQHVNLEEIPRHARLERGDTVLTSGFSAVFPPGLPVGTVDSFWLNPGANFYSIRVALTHDPAKLEYGYVVVRDTARGLRAFEDSLLLLRE